MVLNVTGRKRFLACLARHYDVDNEAINAAIVDRQASTTETETRLAEQRLREALIPRRVRLLSQFNGLSQGVKFLIDLRVELMQWAQQEPEFLALDDDVRGLLASKMVVPVIRWPIFTFPMALALNASIGLLIPLGVVSISLPV